MVRSFGGIIVGMVAGSVLTYLTLTRILTYELVPDAYTRITVKNTSGRNISKVSMDGVGLLDTQAIRDNEQLRYILKGSGENSLRLNVEFDDGTSIMSPDLYFEGGYRVTATVRNSEILFAYE
jgi:hypothetical protein